MNRNLLINRCRSLLSALTFMAALVCFSTPAFADSYRDLSKEIFNVVDEAVAEDLELEELCELICDKLEATISDSSGPSSETRLFLEAYLAEVETRYGVTLTLEQLVQMIKQNIELLGMDDDEVDEFLDSLDDFSSED